ncbi:MAG: class I SAM-dependent methyltransferase [Phycisphaerales bacterium]|nr:class I SAM-dependent methyltransferase [Phycisphaerales bacterium]
MSNQFDKIKKAYEDSFKEHGDSPASLLCPKGRQHLRFSALDDLLGQSRMSVLDYGCGLGHLFKYLTRQGFDVDYHGVDIVPSFVDHCIEKHGASARFDVIDPEADVTERYDIVFASGVFNIKSCDDAAEAKQYAFARIQQLYSISKKALVCDFLTSYVDFQQEGAQHISISDVADFCYESMTRRFVIRHDLLPYEFTLIARADNEIVRPDNVYSIA